ncbi:nucleotide-diphospho-sugar transferase [Maribacter sp. 1_2014MBL_MicDiv]|uniref:nucleotide-diphospho-sugar transferase n=1 Tax=Maribacter sp. 1_2014MBL_MicDiv TaxID=1644130 RepID=UPI0008F548C6|nr:nucleotide-diphospho-sugar transferase [Maribacter sp. 1_2014MBL_MicDiv]APA64677.1 nucleotide-diphospho-sugar transferase [Maribacter sp. 1_2014MBL_MicDiv]
MKTATAQAPVLFIIFNRPEQAKRVFEMIRKAQPAKLYVAADGPRKNGKDDQKCKETRAIIDLVDWDCEVKTLFREENVGCGLGPKTAIDWFFENEEEGIILEDDCLPSLSFFKFCSELLERYRDNNQIMHIGGSNFQNGYVPDSDYSYYFSYFSHEWGWASWRRAWKNYDYECSSFPELKKKGYFDNYFSNIIEKKYRLSKIEKTINAKEVSWWDYQWDYTKLVNSGLSIIPNQNMIKNVGFGEDATHTVSANDARQYNEAQEIDFPLLHPKFIIRDIKADRRYFKYFFKDTIVRRKILGFLRIPGYATEG